MIFSRFLNPNDNEDSAYLVGQPPPPKGSSYFGVFLEVQNKSEETQKLAESFDDQDADHETFDAIPTKASTPSPSAAKSNPRNRSRLRDSTPAAGPDRGLARPLRAARHRPRRTAR